MHVVRTARLRVAVALLRDTLGADGLRDEVAAHWHGVSTPPDVAVLEPDGTTRRLPLAEAVPMFLAAGHNPPAWHADLMTFLARDRHTAAPVVHVSLYLDADGGYQIGGTVGRAFRGRGYGREALTAVCAIAHDHLGIARLRAGCETANVASQRWLASCGFTPAAGPGRHTLPNGRVIEACWWHRSAPAADRCRNRPLPGAPPPRAANPAPTGNPPAA
jgi:RimJ/RimL family protein N-acetyltransferase